MTGDRIGILTAHFRKIRADWQASHSVMAKELQTIMAETNSIAPEHLIKPISLRGQPIPYEIQFGLSNAGDGFDWTEDNK